MYFRLFFIVMAVVGNFYFFIFLRLTWEFLGLESKRRGSVCWPNNKIIDWMMEPTARVVISRAFGRIGVYKTKVLFNGASRTASRLSLEDSWLNLEEILPNSFLREMVLYWFRGAILWSELRNWELKKAASPDSLLTLNLFFHKVNLIES